MEEFTGRWNLDLYPSGDRAMLERVVATREPFRAEAMPFVHPDAPERGVTYWDVLITPILDVYGDVGCLFLSLTEVTDYVCTLHKLQESQVQCRALASGIQTRIEFERGNLARELHDELGQALTVLRLGLMRVASDFGTPHGLGLGESLRLMVTKVDEVGHAVERITNWLTPTTLEELGLTAAVEAEAAAWQSRGRIQCRVRGTLPSGSVGRARETALFRIVQEALTNVVRHAEASLVVISFRFRGLAAVVEIRDNGRGIDHTRIAHHTAPGLAGMRQRAVIVGGTFDIHPRRPGTTVTATVPLLTQVDPS